MGEPCSVMRKKRWRQHLGDLRTLLRAATCHSASRKRLAIEAAFHEWQRLTWQLRDHRGTIYLIGNGASASMASHMAADLAKNAQLHTEVFSDVSLITAISNDLGYDHVFSEPLSRRAKEGDMLVAISSSGRSPNVLSAVHVAIERTLTVVTLSAMDASNPLRTAGTLNFYVPAQTYGDAESCHAVILHHWMNIVEKQ